MTRPRPVSQPDTVGGRSERTGHPRGFRDPTRPEAQSGRRSRSTPSFQQLLGLSTHCPPGREPVTAAPLPTGLPRMQEATLPLPAAGGHCLPQPADHGTPHCHGHGGPRPWQAALALCRVLREPENAGSGAGVPRNAHGGFTQGSGRLPEDARPGAQCGSIRVRLSRPPPWPGWRTQTAERPGTETWALAAVAEQESGLRMRPRKGSHTSRGWSQDGGAGGAARWHAASRGPTRPHAVSRGRTPSAVRARAVRTCVQGAVAAACVLAPGAQGSADLAPGGDAVPGWPRPPPRCAHRAPPPPHEETA